MTPDRDDEPDLFGARSARDYGIGRVAAAASIWMGQARIALCGVSGFRGSGEDMRIALIKRGLPKPHHHNAWGALIKWAVENRHLTPTGEMKHMRIRRSHARKTPVYVR